MHHPCVLLIVFWFGTGHGGLEDCIEQHITPDVSFSILQVSRVTAFVLVFNNVNERILHCVFYMECFYVCGCRTVRVKSFDRRSCQQQSSDVKYSGFLWQRVVERPLGR